MNNINAAFEKSVRFSDFSKRYFNYLENIQKKLDPNELNMFAEEFMQARESNNTIFMLDLFILLHRCTRCTRGKKKI